MTGIFREISDAGRIFHRECDVIFGSVSQIPSLMAETGGRIGGPIPSRWAATSAHYILMIARKGSMSTTPTRHTRLSSPRVGKCSTGPRSASASCGNRTRCSVQCLFSASSSACIAALPSAFRRKQYQAPSAEGRIAGLVPDGKRKTIFAASANAPGNPIACIPDPCSCRHSTGRSL